MIRIQTGYCPELRKTVSIKVELEELFVNEGLSPQYRPLGYSCEHDSLNGCETSGEFGAECPLFQACKG